MGRGGNARAFEIPGTLEQVFPGLKNSPGGAIIAIADNILDMAGPANAFKIGILQDQSRQLIDQIKVLDPKWHYDEMGPTDAMGHPIVTLEGLTEKVNDLRLQRAATFARVKDDYEPLKVETLRFIQLRADRAYDEAIQLLKIGRLTPRLSDREAIGNYVDRQVRRDLRTIYNQLGVKTNDNVSVRVNRREDDSSGTDLTYRRPDARIKDVAFDVTLTLKTLGTPQVRGFFNTDFQPRQVVIMSRSQLGPDHTYVISRPEKKL